MPTLKPRITINFDDDVFHAISDLADAIGCSKSSLVGQLLKEAIPAMKLLTKAAKSAKDGRSDTFDLLAQTVVHAQEKSKQMGLDLQEQKKTILRKMSPKKVAEKEKGEV